jgi:hypothetical protein
VQEVQLFLVVMELLHLVDLAEGGVAVIMVEWVEEEVVGVEEGLVVQMVKVQAVEGVDRILTQI